jgi:hypothetical protein
MNIGKILAQTLSGKGYPHCLNTSIQFLKQILFYSIQRIIQNYDL